MNIQRLPHQFDIAPLVQELAAHPEVWNQHRWRTEHPRSPHREVDDIWVRYNAVENIGPHFNDPHEAVWYPVVEKIPRVKALAEEVLRAVEGKFLGGVLITRIPAGGQVYPHVDQGWHAVSHDKYAVQIEGNAEQSFCFEDASLSALPGELYRFNNQVPHWVLNPTAEDRVTLIVCVRRVH